MFLRCRDYEPRMVSREHWGESLSKSVQMIEKNIPGEKYEQEFEKISVLRVVA